MGAIILPQQQQNPLAAQLMELLAQRDARAAESRRLAQQQSQFQQTFGLDEQRTAAQVAAEKAATDAANVTAGKTKYEIAAQVIEPLKRDFEVIAKNAGPEKASQWVSGQLARFASNPEAQELLRAYVEPRPHVLADDTNANIAKWHADTTGRVAEGGQNAMDVNLATLIGTGQQLSGPAFGNQDTREFGTDALRQSVAIADDRTAGATPRLSSSTQIQVGREGNASAERIAAMRAAADSGGGSAVTMPAGTEGLTGEALLKSLDPATAGLVKAVAEYKVDPTKVASSRNPKNAESERLKLVRLALQYNPTYDMTQFPAMSAARKDFSSGKAAANIRSLNTALKHLDELDHAAKDLHNSRIPIVNRVGNFISKQTGGDPATNFNSAATALSDELATLFKGTAGTDSAIAHWRESLDPSMSPEQFRGQVQILLDLVGGRIAALESQYKATTGDPAEFEILNPTSQTVLKKFGFNHGTTKAPSANRTDNDPLGLFRP